jgi:hypothetical protein
MTPVEMLKAKALELCCNDEDRDFVNNIQLELSSEKGFGFKDGEKLGVYHPFQKKIVLYDVFKGCANPETVLPAIFPIYMHELVHALQHKHCGTLGYLLMLGLFRWKLEKDAREIEDLYYNNNY